MTPPEIEAFIARSGSPMPPESQRRKQKRRAHFLCARRFSKWRRGELNPRPEITQMAASTCLSGVLISAAMTSTNTLRHGPDLLISPNAQIRTFRPARFFQPEFHG